MESLKRIRKARNLTLKELGKMCDVSESAIQMVESGARKPSYELLLKLGEALDCSVDELINDRKMLATESDEQGNQLSEKDKRLIEWFRSLPEEKQRAILISQDAPEELL